MVRIALAAGCINVVQLPQVAGRTDEDIVMIHGLAANLGFWYAVAADKFRQFGRVTLYDMRGHGHSDMPTAGYSPRHMAEDLGQLLDRLQLQRVHLIAHSFGGMVALAFALLLPDRVKSIILADVRVWQAEPASRSAIPSALLLRMRERGLRLEESHMDPSFQVLIELARWRMDRHGAPEEKEVEADSGTVLFRGKRAARRWLDLMEQTSAYQEMTSVSQAAKLSELSRIRQPMLAVFGERSLRRRSAQALRRFCPQCDIVVIPRAGHFFPLNQPQSFANVALEFLSRQQRVDRESMQPADCASPDRIFANPSKEAALIADEIA